MQSIEAMSGHKTMIMIAHRLSTVKNCDHLYQLVRGKVLAQGTYTELLNTCLEFQEIAKQLQNTDA
jgi:ATP-binding cassette subfamily C protein